MRLSEGRSPGRRNTSQPGWAVNLVADLSDITPGGVSVPCRPWDIGTGVQGYAWSAPQPKAVLLLQHGFGAHTGLFLNLCNGLISRLLTIGISVAAFDMWGHGRSPGRRGVTDVRAAVDDHLIARRELRSSGLPVFLMGHSLGGFVTSCSVAQEPDGLAGAIVISAPQPSGFGPVSRWLVNLLAAAAPGSKAPVKAAPPDTLSRCPDLLAQIVADPLVYKGWATTNMVAATALEAAQQATPRLSAWRTPTLVMHGTDDASIPVADSRRLFEAISSADKTLHLVDKGRHDLLNDSDRDAVTQALLRWLQARVITPTHA